MWKIQNYKSYDGSKCLRIWIWKIYIQINYKKQDNG